MRGRPKLAKWLIASTITFGTMWVLHLIGEYTPGLHEVIADQTAYTYQPLLYSIAKVLVYYDDIMNHFWYIEFWFGVMSAVGVYFTFK